VSVVVESHERREPRVSKRTRSRTVLVTFPLSSMGGRRIASVPSWNKINVGSCHDDVDTLIRFSTARSDHAFTSTLPNCSERDEYLPPFDSKPRQYPEHYSKPERHALATNLSERSASIGSCSMHESLQSA